MSLKVETPRQFNGPVDIRPVFDFYLFKLLGTPKY
jgi:hypothetical protein